MSAPATKAKEDDPAGEVETADSDPRTALAELINRLAARQGELAEAETTIQHADELLWDGKTKLEALRQAAADAPAVLARHAIAKTEAPDGVKNAQALFQEAENQLAAIKDLRDLNAELARNLKDQTLPVITSLLKSKAAQVVQEHISTVGLVAQFKAAQSEVARLASTLRYIDSKGGIPSANRFWGSELNETFAPDPKWVEAVQALETNAYASLPR